MPDDPISAIGPDSGGQLELRVSDADRERVVELLRDHAAVGRLTLAELEQRAERAYTAISAAELAELLRDLPRVSQSIERAKQRPVVSIFGSSHRRIKDRVRRLLSIAVMASPDIDLCHVELEGEEIAVTGFVLWGWPDIYVPDSVRVELSGVTLFGGDEERGSSRQPSPGAPVVRVRTYGLVGGYTVWRLPPELQTLPFAQARKAAKKLPRGST